MNILDKYLRNFPREGEGGGSAGGNGGGNGGGAGGGQQQQQAAWYEGKVEAEYLGHMQNNGWDKLDPVAAAAAAIKAHREAQKMIGVPQSELLRIPKPSAPTNEIDNFWQRLGAVKEAKDLDLSVVKSAAGDPMDDKLADALRAAAVTARVPKDAAVALASAVQKHLDQEATARSTELQANINQEKDALERSWGRNMAANKVVAENALLALAKAANLPEDKARAAWDALSKVGGIGAATAMEMLRTIGAKMGEGNFVEGGRTGENTIMSREQAMAEIQSLKHDEVFRERLLKGDVELNKHWTNLHKIAFGQAA